MQEPKAYTVSEVPRCRWNVLDLVTIVARDAARGYIMIDVDMSWAEKLRERLAANGEKVTITAIVLKAIATAQRLYPQSLQGYLPFNMRVNYHEIAGGFTVERFVGDDPGVFFGVIEAPQNKSLAQLASELREYGSGEIKDVPRLKMEHAFAQLPVFVRKMIFQLGQVIPSLRLKVTNATFGLSSLGKYGIVTAFGPCVCACTFGVGTVEDRPVVREGKVTIRPMLTIALSYDQRIIDSTPAAMFVREVKELLEGKLDDYQVIGADWTPVVVPAT